MKIGIISDIHSNNYALECLLRKEKEIDKWLCAGDMVGLFPNVNETLKLIRSHNIICIKGDHEKYLLSDKTMDYSYTGNDSIQKQKKTLSPDNCEYLKEIPLNIDITFNNKKLKMVHDTNNYNKSLKYSINIGEIEKHTKQDILVYGHTHLPAIVYGKNTIILNPGSLGFPVSCIRKGSYILFDLENFRVETKFVDYNIEELILDIQRNNYNSKFIYYLRNNFTWG